MASPFFHALEGRELNRQRRFIAMYGIDEARENERRDYYEDFFRMMKDREDDSPEPIAKAHDNDPISHEKVKELIAKCESDRVPIDRIFNAYKIDSLTEMTERQHANLIQHWDKVKG